MSQDNDQNKRQNRQGQGDNWQGESQGQDNQGSDEMTRESRSSGYSDSETNQGGMSGGNQAAPELDDVDEADDMDEDRDDDDRGDGSPNRRNNIG
jgi:hypothetical protein